MTLRLYSDSASTWIVSCPVCNPDIPEALQFEPLPFKLVPYWVSSVEVALDAAILIDGEAVKVQLVTITLRCKNGHLWRYELQAGEPSDWLGNSLDEIVISTGGAQEVLN